MYATSVFLFSSVVALAMYAFAGFRFAELNFDYSFGFVVAALAMMGFMLGHALAGRLKPEAAPSPWLWAAVIVMPAAAWLATALMFGPLWTFLLWSLVFSLAYVFAGIAIAGILDQRKPVLLLDVALVAVGIAAGLFLAFWLIPLLQGLWAVQMIAAGLLVLSIPFVSVQRKLLSTLVAAWVVGGLVAMINIPLNQRLANWSTQQKTLTKPIVMALANDKALHSQATRWVPWGRMDRMVADRSLKEGFGWLVTNGTAPVPEVFDEASRDLAWWKRHFPLSLYPLVVASPERMLVVAPARGPESAMAERLGVPMVLELTYSANPWEEQHGCCNGSMFKPLRELETSDSRVDLVDLSIPHPVTGVWAGVNAQDEAMLTSEVLQRYRDRLNDGGLLAISTREESLFAKALVSVWMLLLADTEQEVSGLDKQVRAFRLNRLAPFKGSYHYLILVAKTAFSEDQLQKMNHLLSETPVEPLIYASPVKEPPYRIFQSYQAATLSRVARNFAAYFSWKYQNAVDMGPSSRWKTGFFRLSKELHPFFRGLLNICLAVIVYVLLFSARALRTGADTRASSGPSLAVLYFSLLLATLAGALLVMLPLYFADTSLGMSQGMLLLLWSATLAGVVAGGMSRNEGAKFTALLLLPLLVFWGYLKHIDAGILDSGLLSGVLILVSGVSGLVGAVSSRHALHSLSTLYPEATSWGWALYACSLLAGVLLFLRTWSRDGLDSVLVMVALAYGAVFLISLWARRGREQLQVHAVTEN